MFSGISPAKAFMKSHLRITLKIYFCIFSIIYLHCNCENVKVFLSREDSEEKKLIQKQLAYILGRLHIFLDLEDTELEDADDLSEIISNSELNSKFLALGREVSG